MVVIIRKHWNYWWLYFRKLYIYGLNKGNWCICIILLYWDPENPCTDFGPIFVGINYWNYDSFFLFFIFLSLIWCSCWKFRECLCEWIGVLIFGKMKWKDFRSIFCSIEPLLVSPITDFLLTSFLQNWVYLWFSHGFMNMLVQLT